MNLLDFKTRDEWLAGRNTRIGASEVAILFGLAPEAWGSQYTLWLTKTGRAEKQTFDGEWIEFGHRLEPVIADVYQDRTGRKLWTGGGPYVVAMDPACEHLGGTPDRFVLEADGLPGQGVLQIKAAGQYMASDWEAEVPPHVQCQVQSELACTGLAWGSAAVLIGGNRFKSFDIVRNAPFIDEIRETVAAFWWHVEHDKAPPVDGGVATTRALKALHPHDTGEELQLPVQAWEWAEEWLSAKARLSEATKDLTAAKMTAENRLREAIGSATFGVLPDGRRLSLKTTTRHIEARDEEFRTLRMESTKKGSKR